MTLVSSGHLTLLAPPFLAELLDVTSAEQTRLRVFPWESGALPVDPRDIDILVPWVADVVATRSVISGSGRRAGFARCTPASTGSSSRCRLRCP